MPPIESSVRPSRSTYAVVLDGSHARTSVRENVVATMRGLGSIFRDCCCGVPDPAVHAPPVLVLSDEATLRVLERAPRERVPDLRARALAETIPKVLADRSTPHLRPNFSPPLESYARSQTRMTREPAANLAAFLAREPRLPIPLPQHAMRALWKRVTDRDLSVSDRREAVRCVLDRRAEMPNLEQHNVYNVLKEAYARPDDFELDGAEQREIRTALGDVIEARLPTLRQQEQARAELAELDAVHAGRAAT